MDLFNILGIEKLKVHYASQFQERDRILLSSMQNALSRSTRAWFLLHFFVLISADIRILSKSKATFRQKCMHHGYGEKIIHGKQFLVIMISFVVFFFTEQ